MREKSRETTMAESIRILRLDEVVEKTGMSRTAIYDRLRNNDFPEPVKLGPRAVGFVESEVNGFLSVLMKQRGAKESANA